LGNPQKPKDSKDSSDRISVDLGIRLAVKERCKLKGCDTLTRVKTGFCIKHDKQRRRSGCPITPVVQFTLLRNKRLERWIIDQLASSEDMQEALGVSRGCLLSIAGERKHKFKDAAFFCLANSTERDMLLTVSKAVVLTAISLHHAAILPKGVCYTRQMGRLLLRLDREVDSGDDRGIHQLDTFGRAFIDSSGQHLIRLASKVVEQCPDWEGYLYK